MDMDEVVARLEITDVLHRYCRGVDRLDEDLLRGVYHPDGTDHHGRFDGAGSDYAAHLMAREEGVKGVGQHHITNILIERSGDNARVESYFLAFHPHSSDEGEIRLGVAAGRYLDRFERRDGEWRILRRKVIMDWTRDHVMGAVWPGAEPEEGGFPGGTRDSSDLSYEFFHTDTEDGN